MLASPALAASSVRTPHVTVDLVAETLHPAPSRPFAVGFDIRPKAGWHIYWTNPGGSGLAPEADWTLPSGATAGLLRHPTPSLLMLQGVASNVHKGRTVLLDDIRPPAGARPGAALPLKAAFSWLVCSEGECVPEQADLGLNLSIGDGAPDPAVEGMFAKARAALPIALGAPGRYAAQDRRLSLFVPVAAPADLASAHLFVAQSGAVDPAAPQTLEKAKGGVVVVAQVGDTPPAGPLDGVLRFDRKSGEAAGYTFTASPGPVSAAAPVAVSVAPSPSGRASGVTTLVLALAGAIAGGLILNLMPCVFPILSLKALALARSGGGEAEARREAVGYALGAMLTLTALGGALLALRAGGASAGWAFQLQNPRVVALLLVLCVGIGLNLAGLFELPTLGGGLATGGGGLLGSAATGALAAFVATPCTGPFMAGALGAAMLLPAPAALTVFAGLGLGLALPFLAIGFIPRVRALMPRPGPWMQTLRRVLSLPMFATALGLAWVLGRQAGVGAMTLGLGGALLLGLGLWWLGAHQARGKRAWLPFAPLIGAVALALFPAPTPAGTAAVGVTGPLGAQPYTAAQLATLRAAHRPVFVYLTADWCLSCKVNEATSLSSRAVARAFSAAHVAVLEGDWTRGDPEVTKLLTARKRAGVPLYIYYPAGGGARELPQVLTPHMLIGLTDQA